MKGWLGKETSPPKRHIYFTDRGISNCTEF